LPCYDERTSPAYIHAVADKREKALQARLDNVTAISCEMGRLIESKGLASELSDNANRWLKAHKAFDSSKEK
jgi:hypothetical protein